MTVTLARRWVTLALVLIVAALSYVDRQVFTLFMDAIKRDLALSDRALGLLTGLTFALFYALAAFPIARYADHGDRPRVIALCVVIWSIATAACGLATGFWQMALARVGLAAGEAGAGPAGRAGGGGGDGGDLVPDAERGDRGDGGVDGGGVGQGGVPEGGV